MRRQVATAAFSVGALLWGSVAARCGSVLTGSGPALVRVEGSGQAMGGVFTVVAYGEHPASLRNSIEAALAESRRLDRLLSNYRPDSEWSLVNRLAGSQPVHVSDELFALLSACLKYSRESEGTFDVTVGPLVKVWGFFKGSGQLPERSAIERAMQNVGWRNVVLDGEKRTVRFAKRGLEIDPGGIGKGYAVDRMAAVLRADGIRSALISAASSSIYAIGAPPGANGWPIRVPSAVEGAAAETIRLRDQSISTSGTAERSFRINGRVYSHIMDPRTGYPAFGMESASVVAPRTIDSEAWAKPYFILGRSWAAHHMKAGFRVYLCEEASAEEASSCAWVM